MESILSKRKAGNDGSSTDDEIEIEYFEIDDFTPGVGTGVTFVYDVIIIETILIVAIYLSVIFFSAHLLQ